jgi:hypothetical protein
MAKVPVRTTKERSLRFWRPLLQRSPLIFVLAQTALMPDMRGQQPLSIVTTTLPGTAVGADYSQTLSAQGGVIPYAWSVVTGNLPLGLSLDGNTGQISGKLSFPFSSPFVIQVQDRRRDFATKQLVVSVLFPAPQHDVRFAVALDLPIQQIQRFNHVEYGDTIRLGEFPYYCGDPEFALVIDSPPSLSFAGYLRATGEYGTIVDLRTHLNAGIRGQCFFFEHPNAGASATGHIDLNRISAGSAIPLHGQVTIDLLGPILGISFPFESSIPIPAQFPDRIPIDLSSSDDVALDFGRLACPQCWVSAGTHKDIPLTINVGSVGGPRSNEALVLDASVGEPRKTLFGSQAQAVDDLAADTPLWDGNRAGFGVSESLFGSASPVVTGTGILGNLLPIRIKGRAKYKFWFIHGTREYEVILDGANVLIKDDNTIHADLSASRAVVRQVRHGQAVLGHDKNVASLLARVEFDRLRLEGSSLKFRVADFGLDLKTRLFVLPIRLSSGQLEQTLNGGEISLATLTTDFPIALPACQWTGYEKFKSRANSSCGVPQIIGDLSLDAGVQKITFSLDLAGLKFRRLGKTLQLSVPMSAQ